MKDKLNALIIKWQAEALQLHQGPRTKINIQMANLLVSCAKDVKDILDADFQRPAFKREAPMSFADSPAGQEYQVVGDTPF